MRSHFLFMRLTQLTVKLFYTGSSSSSSSSKFDQLKVTHGALAIIGWGVLLPVGAVIARYCRQWEPQWFHLHLFFQLTGYTIGVFTVVVGMSLYYQTHSNVTAHRDLGIFLLVLGTLQVCDISHHTRFRGFSRHKTVFSSLPSIG